MERKLAGIGLLGLLALGLLSTPGRAADKTPAELRAMVQSGRYPKQGAPTDTKSDEMSFAACSAVIETIASSVKPHYPTETVVRTASLWTEKFWTNDGAITVTCRGADRRQIITRAPYR